MADYMSHFR